MVLYRWIGQVCSFAKIKIFSNSRLLLQRYKNLMKTNLIAHNKIKLKGQVRQNVKLFNGS